MIVSLRCFCDYNITRQRRRGNVNAMGADTAGN
jgi:hypothetical protein